MNRHTVASLAADANSLAPGYSRFRVADRLLLTGHSHQAWPDCGFDAQQRAWLDAAALVDDKWPTAFERADDVRRGFCRLLGEDDASLYALGSNTHELVVRFLSSLPLSTRPKLVTTDGEFHSMRRQLDRLSEERVEVLRVAVEPMNDLADRICSAIDDRTAAVLISAVLFKNARIVRGLDRVAAEAGKHGTQLLIDAYHAIGAMPFDVAQQQLDAAFIVGGGYKYCQLGEGNCFLRVPPGSTLHPVITGWYAEFDELERATTGKVRYPAAAADRFAGSTYDPTSHYRAAAVFDFFRTEMLDAEMLRAVSQHQVGVLREGFDALDADAGAIHREHVAAEEIGGFLTLTSSHAAALHRALRERGVYCDTRDDVLRLGPAPYLSDRQLKDALDALRESLAAL